VLGLPADFAALARKRGGRRQAAGARTIEYGGGWRDIDLGLSATTVETSEGPSGFSSRFRTSRRSGGLERDARMQQRLAAVGEMAAGIAHE